MPDLDDVGTMEETIDDARFDDFGIANHSLVAIREEDNPKTLTIYSTPAGSFTSKKLTVPRKEFMRACTEYADMIRDRAEQNKGAVDDAGRTDRVPVGDGKSESIPVSPGPGDSQKDKEPPEKQDGEDLPPD